jgi:hypothetical protein
VKASGLRTILAAAVAVIALVTPAVARQEIADIGLETNGDAWQFYRATPQDPDLPRVLLIGDSIVNGYRGTVCKELDGLANVDTWLTPLHLKSDKLHADLERVLAEGPYDVIHFNIGLHGWTPGRIPDGEYDPLLRAYVEILKKHGDKAKLVWGSTTQITVRDNPEALDPEHNPTIVRRNTIADRVMSDLGIVVNDLYGLMEDKLALGAGDKFHWQPEAREIQGVEVAAVVRQAHGLGHAQDTSNPIHDGR